MGLRRTLDALPGLIWTALPNGEIDFVNQRWCEYTGLCVHEVCGQGWQTAVHPEDLPGVLKSWKSILTSCDPGEMTVRLRRSDGEYRWFSLRAHPTTDASGSVVKWYGINSDIEAEWRAQATQRIEMRLLEMVAVGQPLPGILDAVCRLCEETICEVSCSILLVQPDGLKFLRGAAPSLPSEYTQFFDGAVIDAICGPCSLAVTKKIQVIASDVHSDSRWKASAWPELMSKIGMRGCWCTPILSADQKVQGVLVIYQREPRHPAPIQQEFIQQVAHIASIAIERAQRETALRRNEAFLKEAQRLSSTGGFSWSVATNEITWSDEVYRIFGIEPGGPLTPETTDLRVHPDDLPFIYEKVNRARVDGKDFDFDYRLMMPDGSTKYLHTVFHRTQDSEGAVEFVGAIQDVTERRRSEDALGELRTELAHVARVTTLGALTASIAHEVNQPLSGIMTNASTCLRMLAADPPNINGARETARRTIRDANRASEVITRLRALFTKKGASSERVDMNEAAQEVIALSLNELQRKGVTVRAELAADLPPVTGDRVQLQQVILNLILNASDAMSSVEGRPRLLIVKTEYDHERGVLVAVRDTGIGFDPEHAGRLFEAFYTTKSGGMGIGLSVSRSIVESHHGRLWTEANEGAGATFLFSIPRRADEGDDGSPLVPSYAAPDEILEAAVTVSTR